MPLSPRMSTPMPRMSTIEPCSLTCGANSISSAMVAALMNFIVTILVLNSGTWYSSHFCCTSGGGFTLRAKTRQGIFDLEHPLDALGGFLFAERFQERPFRAADHLHALHREVTKELRQRQPRPVHRTFLDLARQSGAAGDELELQLLRVIQVEALNRDGGDGGGCMVRLEWVR